MKSSSNDICIRDGCDLFLHKVLINMPHATLYFQVPNPWSHLFHMHTKNIHSIVENIDYNK